MTQDELKRALAIAQSAVTEAGEELIKHFGNVEAEAKSDTGIVAHDIVTALDRQTEKLLTERLSTFDPHVGFRGEEFGVQRVGATTWLVDPIDGTSHFVRGLPFCTTMVALIHNGQVLLSIIYDFVRGDMYWAVRGQGAYKNDERIQVSNRPLRQAYVSFETRLDDPENLATFMALRNTAGGIVSTINSGYEFAMVASGKLEGRITKQPYGYDWDFAPGSLLVEEAGGIVTNHRSATFDYTDHDFVAANPLVHRELTMGEHALFPARTQELTT